MFGPGTYTCIEQSPGHLLVSAPGTSLFGLWFLIGLPAVTLLSAFFIANYLKKDSARYGANYAQQSTTAVAPTIRRTYRLFALIGVGGALFFYAVGYTSGSITLDRATNTATMTGKMTAFLPAQHRTVPLTTVTDATLDQKPNSRRIRLEVSAGQDLAFPIWSDRAGQQEAVDSINQFLHNAAQGSH